MSITETTETTESIGCDLEQRKRLEEEAKGLIATIAIKLLSKPDLKDKALSGMEGILGFWAGKSFVKKSMAKRVTKVLSGVFDSVKSMGEMMEPGIAAELGRLVTIRWMIKTDKNRENPTAKADNIAEPLQKFFNNSDFGEMKEHSDSKVEGSVALSTAINEVMWENPGKLIGVMACLPTKINSLARSVNGMMEPMDMVAPDMILDMMTGIFNLVDGKELGKILNSFNELKRKVHVGSLLMGAGKDPELQKIVSSKYREILPCLDPVILAKRKIGEAENSEAIQNALSETLEENLDIVKNFISIFSTVQNAKIRTKTRRLRVLEKLSEDELADSVYCGLEDLDATELSDLINSMLSLMNLIYEKKPMILSSILSSLAVSIDLDELEMAVQWIVENIVEAIKPVSGVIMPSILNGLCELLTPQPGEVSSELDSAITRLGDILCKSGGKK